MRKIYNCDLLNSGLHFTPDNLRFCCAPAYWGPNIDSKTPEKKEIFNKLMEMRTKALEDMRNHIGHKNCVGCIYLKEYDLDSPDTPKDILEKQTKDPLISNIVINHYKQCDCHCIYCTQSDYLKKIVTRPQKGDYYDLFPIIKQFYKEKLIDSKNLRIEFQGGSIGVLKEFPDLVKIFLKNGARDIQFFTNGIRYMPQIVDSAKKTKTSIVCSLDCGTRETFKRMKIVDKFDDVVKNIKKYKDKAKEKIEIDLKYILIEGFNDNKEEFLKFMDIAEYAGVDMVQLDMDFKKVMINKGVHYDVPQHYYELYDLYKEECIKRGIRPFIWEYIQGVLDKGYFE